MWQACSGVLERHGAGKTERFLRTHVRCHAHAADRGSAGDVVDRHHRLEPDRRSVNVHDLQGSQFVREAKNILHAALLSLVRPFQILDRRLEKPSRLAARHHAMIEGERQRQHVVELDTRVR